jgi:hypothetical protein
MHSVRRFRGDDAELVQMFDDAVMDINIHLTNQVNHQYQIMGKG